MVRRIVILFSLLLFWALVAVAQKSDNTTFGGSDDFEFDSVNLVSLVPTLHIPVLSKSAGTLPGSIVLESPQTCRIVPISGGKQWTCGVGVNSTASFYPITAEMNSAAGGIGLVYTSVSVGGGCTKYTITGLGGPDNISFWSLPSTVLYYPTTCGANTATVTTNDNSGYTVAISTSTGLPDYTTFTNRAGWSFSQATNTQTLSDAFSNSIVFDCCGLTPSFTDSLGAQTTFGGVYPPTEYDYTDTTGTTQKVTFTTGSSINLDPLEGTTCGSSGNYGSVTPITSINYPDGTSVGITWLLNGSDNAGVISSFTLRTGGSISYTYGTAGGCTAAQYATLKRTTSDGDTNYSTSISVNTTTTTVLDPGKNKTVYVFLNLGGGYPNWAPVLQSVDRYQNTGSVGTPAYTHISETLYCYNTSSNPCTNTPTYPITQRDVYAYTYTTGGTQVAMSHDEQTYDSYGNVLTDAATDSINSQTITTTYVYGTYSSGTCSAITNTAIVDHPCTITTKNASTWLSGSTYTYNSNGALTASSACLSSTCTGSSALTTTYTPTTQGTYSAIAGPNGQSTSYTYGSCNSLMPTDVTTTVNSVAIDNKATWNCNAGVITDTTDPNSNEADYTYDSMNRISTYHDYMGDTNTTTYAYGTPTLDHVKVTDNIGVVSYQYVDGLGRPTISQVYNGTNYDTTDFTRGWNGTNFQVNTYGACTQTLDNGCSQATATLASYINPIAGPTERDDINGGTFKYAVNSKDFSVTAGPAPSGEHTKVVQTEVDGFGRVTSTCALENSGGTTCGQTMGNSGILTSNVYSFATGAPKVVTTRGSQSHTTIADAVGRTSSVQTPEAGTTTYTYDSISSGICNAGASSSAGDLIETVDAASNKICRYYEGLHRLTDVDNNNESSTNPCRRFRYDSTAAKIQTAPTGYPSSGNNIIGRMFEAETDNCVQTGGHFTAITDEWFAYDAMGRLTDKWQSSTNSGGYYHTTFAYDADGTLTSLSVPTFSTVTYGLDSEERPNSMTYGSTTIVSATAGSGFKYDAADRPTNVPIGSGTNQDAYTYDQLENMLTYTFPVGSNSDTGTLTWNSIGSLGKLVINDTVPSSTDSQTCAYGYDDVARLTSAATITGSTCNAAQTFGYDQYDNMWQSGAFSNGCSTCYSSTNNEQTGTPTLTYDSDGNVKSDTTNTYTWNVYGKLASSIAGSTAATCGSSGVCYVYDAFGMLVEQQENGFNRQHLYGGGSLPIALMNGQTAIWELVPAPGGGMLWVNSGTNYYAHRDWLGTVRLTTVASSNSVFTDQAMTPYGREYDVLGSAFNIFAGDLTDDTGLWFTPSRSFPPYAARWLSPDPAHSGWNAYAYVTDPNTQTDPSGLGPADVPAGHCGFFCWLKGVGNNIVYGEPGSFQTETTAVYRPTTLSGKEFLHGWTGGNGSISRHNPGWGPIGRWLNNVTSPAPNSPAEQREYDAMTQCEATHCLHLALATPSGAGEWEAPTFTEVTPGSVEHLQALAEAFAADNPKYLTAEIGCCATGALAFRDFAGQYGVRLDRLMLNGDLLGYPSIPSQEFATNPQLFYTRGIFHVVSITGDGIVVDTTAMMFRRTAPWVTPFMVYKLTP